ncbi:MAG: DNA repair protein RecN [Candidatus Edwardsbacteria bacterium]|nr:DNA repair protein RecN [Candidatus Edwardsbacteria bacterium]
MLKKLIVKDYALIDSLGVEFSPGLNILTGETSAGKSILIGALGLVLGERADTDSVRSGAKAAIVEAEFYLRDYAAVKKIFGELDLEWSDDLLIRREVASSGKSRAFVNDSPVTLANLKRIGDAVLDMHGQHEHQSLLYEEKHLDYLDGYARTWPERTLTGELFQQHQKIKSELEVLRTREQLTREKLDLYSFQIKEIESASLIEGEDADLESEKTVLENSEKLFSLASASYQLLYQQDGSITEQFSALERSVEEVAGIDPRMEPTLKAVTSVNDQIEEIARDLRKYRDGISFDPQRLEEIRNRLDLIRTLKKKYAGRENSITAVLAHHAQIKSEVDSVEHGEEQIQKLENDHEAKRQELEKSCLGLSAKRQEAAKKMSKEVVIQLKDLGMEKASFKVAVSQIEDPAGLTVDNKKRVKTESSGIDLVRFLISPNPGEELKPLAKIASGGEISRVMLAIKTILSEVDAVPVLVFDEIDAGIGGRIAEAVGVKLKEISLARQVLCITHLPQIASLAKSHFRVSKDEQKGRTITSVNVLSEKEKVEEIARMLGGSKITETTLKHAREMIEK